MPASPLRSTKASSVKDAVDPLPDHPPVRSGEPPSIRRGLVGASKRSVEDALAVRDDEIASLRETLWALRLTLARREEELRDHIDGLRGQLDGAVSRERKMGQRVDELAKELGSHRKAIKRWIAGVERKAPEEETATTRDRTTSGRDRKRRFDPNEAARREKALAASRSPSDAADD